MAEFEAHVQDFKQFGVEDDRGAPRRWQELSEEEKFDRIVGNIRELHLENELAAYRVLGREVDIGHKQDPFDRIVADLPRRWRRDGHADSGETWEEQSNVEKIGYLAGYAATHRVHFDRFVDAAARTLGLASWEEFTADDIGHLLAQIRWAHGDYSEDPARMSLLAAPKDNAPSPAAIADGRDDISPPEGVPVADKPARYDSPPRSIALARETMRQIREALTKDADGKFPASYAAMDWDGMNMQPPDTAWQDLNGGRRYDLLLHALDEAIWSLEPAARWDVPRDSQKLASEFVKEDLRQATPDFRADVVASLMSQLEAFGDEFARLARTKEQKLLAEAFGELVGEVHTSIAYIAEASRQHGPAGDPALPSTAELVEGVRDDAGGITDEQIHKTLADRHEIAITWSTEDVRHVRPNLDEEQAWEVLQQVKDIHDAQWGVSWATLEIVADDLFPKHREDRPLSPGAIAEDHGGPEPPSPEHGPQRGNGR